jgi:predicted aconitase
MEAHVALGCTPTFTCAPYQTMVRPRFGEQVAWGESNAIVFANSVIGARTARYGDFTDLAAAMTGRVPYAGMHVPENRRAEVVLALPADAGQRFDHDALAVAVGAILGMRAGGSVAAITGMPAAMSEDALKALGATAASTGATALFHAVGITPEAPDLATACHGVVPAETHALGHDYIAAALAALTTVPDGTPIAAIALGTPHFSLAEFARLMTLLDGLKPAPGIDLYVNTARDTFAELDARGWRARLEAAGFTLVVDTCTYVTAVMRDLDGPVMTNSGKWAHYAPGNLGIDVAFGTLADCIASAAAGRVTRGGSR